MKTKIFKPTDDSYTQSEVFLFCPPCITFCKHTHTTAYTRVWSALGRHKSKQDSKCAMLSEEKTNFNLLKKSNLQLFPLPRRIKTSSADEKHKNGKKES